MSERVSSSTTYTPSRRLVKRLSAGVTALAVAHITIGVGAAARPEHARNDDVARQSEDTGDESHRADGSG